MTKKWPISDFHAHVSSLLWQKKNSHLINNSSYKVIVIVSDIFVQRFMASQFLAKPDKLM